MTDKLYTQTEGGIRYWTREELLIRAETAEAEVERAEAKAHEFESEAIHNGEIMQSLAAEVTALRERIAELETKNIVATEGKYARTEYMSYWTYDELLIRAQAAEAEVAALKARITGMEEFIADLHDIIVTRDKTITDREAEIAELEAADKWRPANELPKMRGQYLGYDGYNIQVVEFCPGDVIDGVDWPWYDREFDEIPITYWMTIQPLPDQPQEAPAP